MTHPLENARRILTAADVQNTERALEADRDALLGVIDALREISVRLDRLEGRGGPSPGQVARY